MRSSDQARRRISAVVMIPRIKGLSYNGLIRQTERYKRSSISISNAGTAIKVRISADDVTALRASVNAILRDVQVIESVSRAIPKHLIKA